MEENNVDRNGKTVKGIHYWTRGVGGHSLRKGSGQRRHLGDHITDTGNKHDELLSRETRVHEAEYDKASRRQNQRHT